MNSNEFKQKPVCKTLMYCFGVVVIVAIIAWILFSCFNSMPKDNEVTSWYFLHTVMLLIVLISSFLFWKVFKLYAKMDEKSKEFNRKIDWEDFQYKLRKDEHTERNNFDRLIALTNELSKSDCKSNSDLEELKAEVKKLKDQKVCELCTCIKNFLLNNK